MSNRRPSSQTAGMSEDSIIMWCICLTSLSITLKTHTPNSTSIPTYRTQGSSSTTTPWLFFISIVPTSHQMRVKESPQPLSAEYFSAAEYFWLQGLCFLTSVGSGYAVSHATSSERTSRVCGEDLCEHTTVTKMSFFLVVPTHIKQTKHYKHHLN